MTVPNRFTEFMDVVDQTKNKLAWEHPLEVGIANNDGDLMIRVYRDGDLMAAAPFTPGQEQEAADDLARQLIAIFPIPSDDEATE